MSAWTIRYGDSSEECAPGLLEGRLRELRRLGVDQFTVTAPTESPGLYVPELERPEVPDTLPEEWTDAADPA